MHLQEVKMPRRSSIHSSRLLTAALAVLSGLTISLAACTSTTGQQGGAQPTAGSTIILNPLRQLVEMERAGSDEWEPVRGPISVDEGYQIRTSVGGVALLVFSENTYAEVHPNSVLVIERYEASGTRLIVELNLLSGQALNHVGTLSNPKSQHVLRTPSATVTVTGTSYWSWVDDDGGARFQPTEGGINIALGNNDLFPLDAGGCIEIQPGGNPGEDCSGEPAPNPLTQGDPSLLVSSLTGSVDLSGCGDGICDESVGENRFSCRLDCNKASCGNRICEPEETSTSCPSDCIGRGGAICGDGVCQPGSGEDFITCQADCDPPPLFCGDGICTDSLGEDINSCAVDCAPLGYCGDGQCNPDTGEDEFTCAADCGYPVYCGDDVCEPDYGEDAYGCPEDCPPEEQCGNDICEPELGERETCTRDCPGPRPPPVATCGDGTCDANEDNTTCPDDCPTLPPDTCGDGICDPAEGEDDATCPIDCSTSPPPDPVCGDGTCDPGEDDTTCPDDCSSSPPPDPVCGDGTCDPGEDDTTCPDDCSTSPPPDPVCGDGTCDPGEDDTTCPDDCSSPPPDPCGDGICDPAIGEDDTTCPADCPSSTAAGNPDLVRACVIAIEEPVCRLPTRAARPPTGFGATLFGW
jgi:hypothetical protein